MSLGISSQDKGLPNHLYDQLHSSHLLKRVDLIKVDEKERRSLNDGKVQELMKSINETGLRLPIGVRVNKDGEIWLIWGYHRLEAWRRLFTLSLQNNDADGKARWAQIPVFSFENPELTDEMAKVMELQENLVRSELTPQERDRQTSEVLELMGKVGKKSTKNGKVPKTKSTNDTFSVPTQKEVIATLNLPKMTFNREFKTYQQDAGISVNWTKLTEEQYDGFVKWYRDRAAAREAEEKANEEEKEKMEVAKRQKEKDKLVADIRGKVMKLVGITGNAEAREVLLELLNDIAETK